MDESAHCVVKRKQSTVTIPRPRRIRTHRYIDAPTMHTHKQMRTIHISKNRQLTTKSRKETRYSPRMVLGTLRYSPTLNTSLLCKSAILREKTTRTKRRTQRRRTNTARKGTVSHANATLDLSRQRQRDKRWYQDQHERRDKSAMA